MSRMFADRAAVEQWFAENHPLTEKVLGSALDNAETHAGRPGWWRITTKYSVRYYQEVWEVQGITV